MNLRQKEEVRLELDIAPEAFLFKVPRFSCTDRGECINPWAQPAGRDDPDCAVMKGRHLVLAVKDDGIGMDEAIRSRLPAESRLRRFLDAGRGKRRRFSHIGLQNVMERMSMVFGEAFQCHVYSEPGQER